MRTWHATYETIMPKILGPIQNWKIFRTFIAPLSRQWQTTESIFAKRTFLNKNHRWELTLISRFHMTVHNQRAHHRHMRRHHTQLRAIRERERERNVTKINKWMIHLICFLQNYVIIKLKISEDTFKVSDICTYIHLNICIYICI